MRRLIGGSIWPMVGSICNMGVWDKSAAEGGNGATCHTVHRQATAHQRHNETGHSLDNGGCAGEQHILVDRYVVLLCILH